MFYKNVTQFYFKTNYGHCISGNKSSAVDEMGDRLATIDMGRKPGGWGLLFPFPMVYLRTKWHLGLSSRLTTIYRRYKQTDGTSVP